MVLKFGNTDFKNMTDEQRYGTDFMTAKPLLEPAPNWGEPQEPTPDFAVPSEILKAKKTPLESIKDMMKTSTEKPSYLFDGLIPTGCVTLLVGKAKCGKSTLAFHMAHTLGESRDFAGYPKNPAIGKKTLWISVEGGWQHEIIDRETPGWENWLWVLPSEVSSQMLLQPNSDNWRKKWVEVTEAIIDDGEFGLIVVDHLLGLIAPSGKSINDDSAVTQVMTVLNAVAQRTGCAVVLLHHRSDKRGNGNPILGSSAIAAMARATMQLSERTKTSGQQTINVNSNRAGGQIDIEIVQTPTTFEVLLAEQGALLTDPPPKVKSEVTTSGVTTPATNDTTESKVRRGRGHPRKPRVRTPRVRTPATNDPVTEVKRGRGRPKSKVTTPKVTTPAIAPKKSKSERQAAILIALKSYDGEDSVRAKATFVSNHGVEGSLTTLRGDISTLKV